jgi:extracellular factor (EF) 3-hydroxypalmitic acid methyl ester biosynthesis protein
MHTPLQNEVITFSKEEVFTLFYQILSKGGPDPEDFEELNHALAFLPVLIENDEVKEEELQNIIDNCSFLETEATIMGHIKRKPFGYAGDYAIIDRIYQKNISKEFSKWDAFSVNHPAAEAVRNRKDYFLETMQTKVNSSDNLRLLNVASGPARDLCELYNAIRPDKLQTTCIEYDKRAISHAQKVCDRFLKHISFINENIFRFDTEEQYDVVWSAGLFDYFDNKTFVRVLSKLIKWAAPGGEIIIGNFSDDNPSRAYMEIFGEWHLHHRSPAELQRLAVEAGAKAGQIIIDEEPLGINLFLRIKNV